MYKRNFILLTLTYAVATVLLLSWADTTLEQLKIFLNGVSTTVYMAMSARIFK